MKISYSISELNTVVKSIMAQNPAKVILFRGEMGVGKTTLIKELAKFLGVNDATSSPTFSLVNEYLIRDHEYVYHFDMYRLKHESEAIDMGIDDYFYSGNWCFVEWSENIPHLIPEDHAVISITLLEDGRRELTLE
ncbi:MAG: tRNA (adenosine(37)-N6)-threonylcarbamoyltransferase complex ATPase subunit type 1 TsaE [Flavobacterium sp.]|jgi:tRNA threonylcarbamoyladenosine biosynthesis protein TsaE|nr:tRNA (adenosine(37)-N6)-threonylcarbamoyltransferase complex ATPase subunit type 1 TsaE [Flavobacterium sp.]MBP6099918.1 tRNA (adenosine(37)-N6)-threonylcarbamoyltransferase complex ATPase subunit type 1 TsaE [Flavobacterium sp.]